MQKILRNSLIIGIVIALLTPISLVIADDTEPPVITNIFYTPHIGVRTDPGFSMAQSCTVTDNVSVADVRINITGPVGFTPINDSMVNTNISDYGYNVNTSNVSVAGTYAFYIWAVDTSGNGVRSNTYYMLVFDNYLSYVHVDMNNTGGPWNGSATYPLQYINDALVILAPNGTIFIHDGVYLNTSISLTKNMNLIGENQTTTILDGGVNNSGIVHINGSYVITISNLTMRNALNGLQAENGGNTTVSLCTISQCTNSGITLFEYHHLLVTNCTLKNNFRGIQLTNCSDNQFYHNNFWNNMVHVSCYFNTSNNTWDNGVTGNYWDNYRILYPGAHVLPASGTWDTAYLVNASGNNFDNHPWVYPNGFIDSVPPQVNVVYPNGGEVVTGNVTIQWTAFDALTANLNGTITIEYSPDNGSSWVTIASSQANDGVFPWNTTVIPDGDAYFIKVSASDEFLNIGSDTSNASFFINNHLNYPPVIYQINGPSAGGRGIKFNFTINATDPEGDLVYYKWDWNDGNVTEWLGPFTSGEPMTISYAWMNDGNYSVQVKARDIGGGESNWSAVHLISIAPQVNFSNVNLGYIYFKLFSFEKSFIYSDFLRRLGTCFILTSHEMSLEAYATNIVKTVAFKAYNQLDVLEVDYIDDNGTDGFGCNLNVSRGVYTLNVTGYDANGTLVDKASLVTVFFIRIGRYAAGPQTHLQRMLSNIRLRH